MACEIETRDMDEYERGVIFRLDACCRRPRARQGARSAAAPKRGCCINWTFRCPRRRAHRQGNLPHLPRCHRSRGRTQRYGTGDHSITRQHP